MIKEANISLTPEKIDELILKIEKDVESAKNIFQTSKNKVEGMTIGDIVDNPSAAENYKDKLTKALQTLSKKHGEYFDIIDMYDDIEMPKNVRALEKLVDLLDNYYLDLSKVEDALDDIISAASRLTNFYNK